MFVNSISILSGSERLLRFRRRRDPWIGDKAGKGQELAVETYSNASGSIRRGNEKGGEERWRVLKDEEVDGQQDKDTVVQSSVWNIFTGTKRVTHIEKYTVESLAW